MSKDTEIATKDEGLNSLVMTSSPMPEFMQQDEAAGVDASLLEDVTPPRLKIIQKMSDDAIVKEYGEGSVLMIPEMIRIYVYDQEESLIFIPLFYYKEWCVWNHLDTRGTLPSIDRRSFDPASDIALRARDFGNRVDEAKRQRYVEHINYIIALRGVPMPVMMSFSRGEHRSGRKVASLISMRRQGRVQSPLFGNVFEARVGKRTNNKGTWYGFNVDNPRTTDPWVTDVDEYNEFKKFHDHLAELHAAQKIKASYDDDTSDDTEAGSGEY